MIVGSAIVAKYVIEDVHIASQVSEHQQASERQRVINTEGTLDTQTPPSFTEEGLIYLTTVYLGLIKQPIDEDYHLTEVASMDELYALFDEVATANVSEPHLDYYFTETETGIYLRPTELPPWFDRNQPYDIIHVSDQEVVVRQMVENIDLYGPYTIELQFSYDKSWKITDVEIVYNKQ